MTRVPSPSICWGLEVRYCYGGKTDEPFTAGRFWDDGEWTGCWARTYRTRAEARAAAARTRSTEKREDGWKVLVLPVRLEITVRALDAG